MSCLKARPTNLPSFSVACEAVPYKDSRVVTQALQPACGGQAAGEGAGFDVQLLQSLRDLVSLASLAFKTLFAGSAKRTAVLFSIAKKYRCRHFFGQLAQIYPGVQLLFHCHRGNIEWKPKYETARTIERCIPALSADAHCSVLPRAAHRSRAAGHSSRFTHHSSLSPSTRVLIATQILKTDLTCSKQTPKNFLIATFSAVFYSLPQRRDRAPLFLIGSTAIRNCRNPMKTNGGLRF